MAATKKKTTRKSRTTKTRARSTAAKKKAPASKKPAGSPTLAEVAEGFLAHLADIGKSTSTITSYRGDLGIALRELGADTKLSALTARKVQTFFDSAAVTKNRAGKPKSPITTAKIRRVLRLALTWAAEAGLVEEAPIPAKSA